MDRNTEIVDSSSKKSSLLETGGEGSDTPYLQISSNMQEPVDRSGKYYASTYEVPA